MIKNTKQAGFTLVEMIIYLAIVGVVLVSISYLILDIIGGQTKSDAGQEVNYNIRFISDQLNSDIAAAQDIGGLTGDTLNLNMATDDVIYSFDSTNNTLVKKVGAGASTTISTSAVDVTGSFTNNSFGNRSRNVGINLEINYKNPDNLPNYNSSTTAAWSVELRRRR